MSCNKDKTCSESSLSNVSVAEKTVGVPQTPWRSIVTVSIFTFCTMAQFTLYFSSMSVILKFEVDEKYPNNLFVSTNPISRWPFLQIIDDSTTEVFYGVIIAAYSVGQISSGPIIGWWSTKVKSIIAPSQFCLFISLIGNVIYITASLLPAHQKWCVLVGRFLVGVGESRTSLFQTYTATASTHDDRTKALSITTGGIALGFSVGPAIQLIFTPIGYPGFHIAGKMWINMYTAPAIICCIINILCMVVMQFLFDEKYAGLANPDAKSPVQKKVHVPKYDKLAVATCHLSRFVQIFVFVNLETIGTPFAMAMFALSSVKAVQIMSIAHSVSGLLGFSCYMVHAFSKKEIIDYRKLLTLAYLGFMIFHIASFPFPFVKPGQLKTYTQKDVDVYNLANHTGPQPVGCPADKFHWCTTTGQTNFWIFIIGIVFFLGLCWPNVNVSLSTLLSKILGPRRQANQQSLYQMSASAARLVGPIVISNVYTVAGPMFTWCVEICILIFIIIVGLLMYRRMVPLKMPDQTEFTPTESEDSGSYLEEEEDKDAHNYARF